MALTDLPQWLAYIERQHPKSIDMGLERVRDVAARMALEQQVPQEFVALTVQALANDQHAIAQRDLADTGITQRA